MSYCDIPEFYDESEHIARKQQSCVECTEPILPGDKYVSCRGKWGGRIETFKQHMPCYHIARWCNLELDIGGGDCIPFGGIVEALGEYGQHDDNDNFIPYGTESCTDIEGYWYRWLHGIHEVFAEGAGI